MIKIENLTKDYGNIKALLGVSLDIEKAETFAIVGPNGAGKTTLLNTIVGLVHPSGGKITVDNIEVSKNPKEIKKRIGYLPQRISFHENLSVLEVIEFYASLRGVNNNNLENVLSAVGILEQRNKKVGALSGGMLQRLALAQAIISDPPILILDEPTISLDPEGRIALLVRGKVVALDTLGGLRTRLKMGSILEVVIENLSSQALSLVEDLGAKNATINGNRLRFFITPEDKSKVIKTLVENGFNVMDLWTEDSSLEEIFIKFTEANSDTYTNSIK